MIETRNLLRTFQSDDTDTYALQDVNLKIDRGEFVAIMGPSGCGKSTLLNILGLLDNPTAGKYYFEGEEVSGYNEKQRAKFRKRKIGFIFQNFNLIDELTVFENIELPLLYLGIKPQERRNAVLSMMEQLELLHRSKHFPLQLSGGQQQRVAIARAVIASPCLILADEPTGNLDSSKGEEVMNLLSDLNNKGSTIVMVTHSQRDAEFSSRIVNLFDGKIISERK